MRKQFTIAIAVLFPLSLGCLSSCDTAPNSNPENLPTMQLNSTFTVGSNGHSSADSSDSMIFRPVQIQPERIYEPPLLYPQFGNAPHARTLIQALVSEQGDIIAVQIGVSSGIKAFDLAAVHQAWESKYHPAILDDQPVRIWVSYWVAFNA